MSIEGRGLLAFGEAQGLQRVIDDAKSEMNWQAEFREAITMLNKAEIAKRCLLAGTITVDEARLISHSSVGELEQYIESLKQRAARRNIMLGDTPII